MGSYLSIRDKKRKMDINCKVCGYKEKINMGLIVKIIGGVMLIGGYWVWIVYLFVGIGICNVYCCSDYCRKGRNVYL